MDKITDRIKSLRKEMKKRGISAYYMTTADFHGSEYVHDYFKVREYFSGFTGSNGDLLIGDKWAALWTDGRYFVQAEKELEGSGIELMKMGEEGVPDEIAFLKQKLKKKDVLGFDGRTVTASFGKKLKAAGKEAGFSLSYKDDITDGIFNRPAYPVSYAEVLSSSLTGLSVKEKLDKVREELKKKGAEALVLTKLDDIMYLYNIRGRDVLYNPVLMSYAYVSEDISVLFVQQDAVTDALRNHCNESDTMIMDYWNIEGFFKGLQPGTKVLIDPGKINFYLYKKLKNSVKLITGINPTEEMKALKNETEIENLRKVCLKDSLAVSRFILELKYRMKNEPFTEMSAAELLLKYRKETEGFREPSFETISAYGGNAAMMHYEPSDQHEVVLKERGMLLVDSGGQYNGGTTDVTRTIVLGELTEEEKRDYTLTACSMLNLMHIKWLEGCVGQNLDIIARKRMWDEGMDYKCGTGHGVGYMLNVHEGPQNIRWKKTENSAVLKSGMLVTDEPGVYKKDKHGIRIENMLLVKEWKKTDDGQFLEFENLTHVPIDDKGIDRSIMTAEEISYYEEYQRSVLEALKPFLTWEETEMLKEYSGIKS